MAVNTDLQIDGVYYTFNANGQMTTKTPLTENDALGKQIAAYAQQFIGYPYVWGGDTDLTQGVDCSGFTMYVYKQFGYSLPHSATSQWLSGMGTKISSISELQPGDLVFFVGTYDTPGVSHVGLYVGNSVMLHCGDPISYTNLNSNYWQSHFYSFGRLP